MNSKKVKNRAISLLVAAVIAIAMMPAMAFACDYSTTPVLMLKAAAKGNTSIELSWNAVDGANEYVVCGARCGKDYDVLGSTNVQNFTATKLSAHKSYKFYVEAKLDGKTLKSRTIHFIAANTKGKVANTTKVKLSVKDKMLKPGQTYKIKAGAKVYKNKKHIGSGHGAKFKYTSDCPEVATVDQNGVVTAVNYGKATIYVQDICGVYAKMNVNVYKYAKVDGVTYKLSDNWTYDDEEHCFTNKKNEDACYNIEGYWYGDECSSYAERKATFEPDGSDGFDLYTVCVNGTKALLVCEPVNEIKDYNLFFYVNGKEHVVNYETDFECDSIAKYTAEFIKSIRW